MRPLPAFAGLSIACVAATAPHAAGAVAAADGPFGLLPVYVSNFDGPTAFVPGSPLLGHPNWPADVPASRNPAAATIQTDVPRSGGQYVRVSGADLQPFPDVAPYTAAGSYRLSIQYNPIGVPAVILYTQARLDGPQTPAGADTAAAGLAARGPGPAEALLGEIEISSDGRVNAFDAAAAGGRTPTFSAPVTLGAYHALAIRADFGADSYQFFVDGSPLRTPVPFDPRLTSGVIGEAELVAHARGTAAERGAYTYRFDDVIISLDVPEPTGLASFGAAVVVLLARRGRSVQR